MILQTTTTAQKSVASKKHHQHPPIVTSPVDSSADTNNMPAIEEEEDIDKTMMVIYDDDDAQLSSFPFCGADAVDVLACADTVEDILPNNHVTRYLKSKFETDSTRDDEENDESTLNTLNTTMNTTTTGLNSTPDRAKDKDDDDDDDNRTVEMAYPDDEGIETCLFSDEDDGNQETSTSEKPEYLELLSDLHLDSSPAEPDDNNQKTTTTTKGIDGDEQDPTMMETSMESGVMSLRFSPWLGGGGGEEGEGQGEPPKEPPQEAIANDSVPTIAKTPSGDQPDDATAVSKATTFKGDDGKTICSLSTECGFEVIGKGFEQGAAVPLKKKRSLLERIGSNISHKSEAKSMSEATADASREHRLEEMKSILSGTAIESTKKKKGKRRIWRIGKKKGNF